VIRELAENPNLHQALSPGRELLRDPAGRFAVYLTPGTSPRCATVQRVRLAAEDVEWELGESTRPPDLVRRLLDLGLRRDEDEPVAVGMTLCGLPGGPSEPRVEARRVASVDELAAARRVQSEAFGSQQPLDDAEGLAADFGREGHDGATFVALLDGRIVAAAYSAYTPWGVILFGGGTLDEARGRGAYRSLVTARAHDAAERGTPVLVTHAGRMSRPILERLGFTPVARIDRLLDSL
jgi:hypothetical protein